MPLNPFVWTGPIQGGVPRLEFTRHTAMTLKAGTHVAMFGPRGTGKTTLIGDLAAELALDHEADAPPWETVCVDLRRAISIPAFIGAVSDALGNHPSEKLRRKAMGAISTLEKDIGINLGFVKAGVRSGARQELNESEVLHGQLAVLPSLADRIVVVLDEFQRLHNCPGEPLSLIRSALMGPEHSGHVSLMLTGSLRERMKMMLHDDTEPIWDQTHDVELPSLDFASFTDYLQTKFEATGKPIADRAIEHLIGLTNNHPKRTQHVAWYVWDRAEPAVEITPTDVQEAFDYLIASGKDNTDFTKVIDTLLSGNDSEENDAKALFLLANGGSTGSDIDAHRYGLSDEKATSRAVKRLSSRGLVQRAAGEWAVVDPLLEAWLRKQDPLQIGTTPEPLGLPAPSSEN
jgi:AAA domain-containing protein